MSYTTKIAWEKLRSVNTATMVNPVLWYPLLRSGVASPLIFPSYILKLVNNSNVLVLVSINGVDDIDVAPASSFWLYDESKVGMSSQIPAVPAGTQVYVQSAAAGIGSVYLVSQYIVQT